MNYRSILILGEVVYRSETKYSNSFWSIIKNIDSSSENEINTLWKQSTKTKLEAFCKQH